MVVCLVTSCFLGCFALKNKLSPIRVSSESGKERKNWLQMVSTKLSDRGLFALSELMWRVTFIN